MSHFAPTISADQFQGLKCHYLELFIRSLQFGHRQQGHFHPISYWLIKKKKVVAHVQSVPCRHQRCFLFFFNIFSATYLISLIIQLVTVLLASLDIFFCFCSCVLIHIDSSRSYADAPVEDMRMCSRTAAEEPDDEGERRAEAAIKDELSVGFALGFFFSFHYSGW